ncbi:MAG: hypothetical protein SFX74_07080 [Fimbriimonadaceae bacterium]|nr:hypothetical protein [Fimbriimonadaceae bacterium]
MILSAIAGIMLSAPIAAVPMAELPKASPILHEADCPFCRLKLVQNTETEDNEVVLRFGNKKIEYRCLFCVIKDQRRYKGNLVVYAPSEKVGEPIVLKRTDGKWTGPEAVRILNQFKSHGDCAALSRAFTTEAALLRYATDRKVADPKPLTLEAFIREVERPK